MNNKTYDIIKNCALIVVPVTAFASAMIAVWHLPYASELTATLTALDTFAGAFVIVAKKIHDGKTEPTDTPADTPTANPTDIK
jgi:hypothetical protein